MYTHTDICTHIQRKNKRGLINYKLVLISSLVIHPVSFKKKHCFMFSMKEYTSSNIQFLLSHRYLLLSYFNKLSSILERWLTGGSIPRSHIRQLPMTCISNSSLGVYGHHILIVYRNHEGIHVYTQVKLNE